MISLVALDVAGTTVQEHGAGYEALRETVLAAGGLADDVPRWMGASKREAIAAMLGRSDVDAEFADFKRRLAALYEATPPSPLPGVPEALAKLRTRPCWTRSCASRTCLPAARRRT